nr:unnamed protein product [Callosobruchus chinensis]
MGFLRLMNNLPLKENA